MIIITNKIEMALKNFSLHERNEKLLLIYEHNDHMQQLHFRAMAVNMHAQYTI